MAKGRVQPPPELKPEKLNPDRENGRGSTPGD
jgi:hypothetical protein